MSTADVATFDHAGSFDPKDAQILSYLGLNPGDPRSRAVVAVASHYDLDPLLRHIIIIPKSGVYITRDGLLHVAHSSGQLDGIVVDQEPVLSDDGREWVARVSVWRKDMGHPFTFPGRYPTTGQNREYAQEMALKAAESHALRRAFDVTGMPARDERRTHSVEPVVQVADLVRDPEPEPVADVETGEVVEATLPVEDTQEPEGWGKRAAKP